MLNILCFHRIVSGHRSRDWPWLIRGSAITSDRFEELLAALSQVGDFVDEDEAVAILDGQLMPERPCYWLTFDDGYRDNLRLAAPILKEHGATPTLFLTSQVLQEDKMLPVDRWYQCLAYATKKRGQLPTSDGELWGFDLSRPEDRERFVSGPEKRAFKLAEASEQERWLATLRAQLQPETEKGRYLYLGTEDLTKLGALNWFVGMHGVTHTRFTSLDDRSLRHELLTSHEVVEKLATRTSRWLAYPDGAVDQRVVDEVKRIEDSCDLRGAVTIQSRTADGENDRWRTPRFLVKGCEFPKQSGVGTRPVRLISQILS